MVNSECAQYLGAERCEVPNVEGVEYISLGFAILTFVVVAAMIVNDSSSFGTTLLDSYQYLF